MSQVGGKDFEKKKIISSVWVCLDRDITEWLKQNVFIGLIMNKHKKSSVLLFFFQNGSCNLIVGGRKELKSFFRSKKDYLRFLWLLLQYIGAVFHLCKFVGKMMCEHLTNLTWKIFIEITAWFKKGRWNNKPI